MINFERTKEVYGYDLNSKVRRSKEEVEALGNKKLLKVIDNCPSCQIEREISLRQSRKNVPCPKCFHSTPEMQEAKRNQTKIKTEEHKQKLKANHWSTKGMKSPFKNQTQTVKAKTAIKEAAIAQHANYSPEYKQSLKIKESCTKRGIALEDFDGFSAPEGTRIRQSTEGRAWSYDVLAKANFTCEKCQVRGGSLHAHHKNGFNAFPEQRFDVDNGACLCHDCHEEFHRVYGKGGNTAEQYEEWCGIN